MKKCLTLVSGLLLSTGGFSQHAAPKMETLHEKILTVDTHCDTPLNMLGSGFDIGRRHQAPQSRVDLPRMKAGGLDALFFAVFTGQKPRTPQNYDEAYRLANQMIDSSRAAMKKYDSLAELALTADDATRLEKAGKRAIYLGMENGFPIGKKLERVEEFYRKGIRYITLCHSYNNDLCDSSTDPKGPEHNGLSEFGRQVVREMNRLGIMIDVSHISDNAFFEVLEASAAPVIASHSSVRAIARHNRNMTDEMIRQLAQKGGVIQICLLDEYVKDPDTTSTRYRLDQEMRQTYRARSEQMSDAEKTEFRNKWNEMRQNNPKKLPTVADYVDHIDHVVKLAGIDHVGIGSDFDGGGALADCQDVSQFPNITRELLARGYSENEIAKIWGGNFFRVFREAEKVARNWK